VKNTRRTRSKQVLNWRQIRILRAGFRAKEKAASRAAFVSRDSGSGAAARLAASGLQSFTKPIGVIFRVTQKEKAACVGRPLLVVSRSAAAVQLAASGLQGFTKVIGMVLRVTLKALACVQIRLAKR
jgi:hypothetical protein